MTNLQSKYLRCKILQTVLSYFQIVNFIKSYKDVIEADYFVIKLNRQAGGFDKQ